MKTQLQKPAAEKGRYGYEFKLQAVEQWKRSGRSAAVVAAELGIRAPLLYRWATQFRLDAQPGVQPELVMPKVEQLQAEIRRLTEENAKLLEQREVLKKIAGHPLRNAAERYAQIERMSGAYKLKWLCEALLVSRSGYYDWRQRRHRPGLRQRENAQLRERIREEFARSRETYGSPRLAHQLGLATSRNRIARLMRVERLRARQRSKYRVMTTDSRHHDPVAPNRLLTFRPEQRDEVWVTDATYVLTGQGWLYIVALLDLYTRRVVGWAMGDNLDAQMAVSALRMAIAQRRPTRPLIVHSDRGNQFTSVAFRRELAAHQLLASMSRKANCYDNAHIEAFWSSLKYELIYQHRFATRADARAAIFNYIEAFYNRTRLHSSLGYLSPVTFESKSN